MKLSRISKTIQDIKFFFQKSNDQDSYIEQFALALFFGVFSLYVTIVLFLPSGIGEDQETILFVIGWMIAPIFTLLSAGLFRWLHLHFTQRTPLFYPFLLSVNTITFSVSLLVLNAIVQTKNLLRYVHPFAFSIIGFVLLVNLISLRSLNSGSTQTANRIQKITSSFQGWGIILFGTLVLLPFIGLYPYYPGYWVPALVITLTIAAGGIATFINRPAWFKPLKKPLIIILDIGISLLIVIASFDPGFSTAPGHQNFYLGPVNRLLHGGSMLVDTFSQYGNLSILFLASIYKTNFLPFTYQSLTLIISILCVFQFLFVYFLLATTMVKDRFYAILILCITLLLSLYGTIGILQDYPSTGPLRFGIVYLLLVFVLLRHRYAKLKQVAVISEYLLVGIAALWSFETFVYTVFAYTGICLFESIARASGWVNFVKQLVMRLVWILVAVFLCLFAFTLITYLRTGVFPNWKPYFEFIGAYSGAENIGSILIVGWSPWIIPLIIYFGSLMAYFYKLIFSGKVDRSIEGEIALGLTFFGIAQYTYYLGRSHPNNLFHISIPAIILAGYWFVKTIRRPQVPDYIKLGEKFFCYCGVILIFFTVTPTFVMKYNQNHTGFKILAKTGYRILTRKDYASLWKQSGDELIAKKKNPQIEDALQLIQKYAPGQATVALFMDNTTTTETLFLAKKNHTFPMNDPIEDLISPTLTKQVEAYQDQLQLNDIIFAVDPAVYLTGDYNTLLVHLIRKVCNEFTLQELEQSPHGVTALKLVKNSPDTGPYCSQVRTLDVH